MTPGIGFISYLLDDNAPKTMPNGHDGTTLVFLKFLSSERLWGSRKGGATDIVLTLVSEQLEQFARITTNPMHGRVPDD